MTKDTKICLAIYLLDAVLIGLIATNLILYNKKVRQNEEAPKELWTVISDSVTATVYNACPGQCNEDYTHTACMYKLEMQNISNLRVLAMERTMMAKYGIRYGDVIRIEGAGKYNGEWQVLDTMNKRFANQEKIDLLVPSHIRHGKWKNVTIYVPQNEYARKNAANRIAAINNYRR